MRRRRVVHRRVTADVTDDLVVFLIGMRLNKPWRVRQCSAAFRAMLRMLAELRGRPDLGLLHADVGWFFGGPGVIEYWRSYDHLADYARARDSEHLPAWRAYHRLARSSDAVGIYHETYLVGPGRVESVYDHMPAVGLLAAAGPLDVHAGSTSSSRLRAGGR